MLKTIRLILILLTMVTILALGGLLVYSSGRTYFNGEEEVGNTSGNIYNGGLFCERGGRIFFSNDMDDGSLYVMNSNLSNVKKISDDKSVFINADDNYIYYVRANNTRENQAGSILMFFNNGVYRLNHNGKGLKAFTGNPGAYLMLRGNNIYFQRYDVGTGLFLYRYQIDATRERMLVDDAVIPSTVIDNSLIYNGYSENHNINAMNLSSYTSHTKFEGNYYYPIFQGDYIYYMNLDDKYRIYRMNSDGSEPTRLVKERCFTYNITEDGRYLFYQVDNGKNNRICRLNLQTMESRTLMEGDFKQIHIAGGYVFFKDYDNTNTYIMDADGIIDISTFEPPNLSATASPSPRSKRR
ncbi:hypothetical protein HNQ56_004122 [Anaerotaenia torta]|uniref:DUF5050 domain-containing protein n=1 Tax=Anaerotaenia torta TaxID=433293 RepID=UPI003D19DEAE